MLATALQAIGARAVSVSTARTVSAVTELQQLRDRVAELEELLGMKTPQSPCRLLHLTPTEEKLCGLLLKRPLVTQDIFFVAVYGNLLECDQPKERMLDVYICKLRKKLSPLEIEITTRPWVGYYLPAESKSKLVALLEDRV